MITITGTNDAPVITVVGTDSAAETLAETNAALTTSGTLTVVDLDLSDSVTATVLSVAASGTTTGLGSGNAALLAMLTVTAARSLPIPAMRTTWTGTLLRAARRSTTSTTARA